MNEVVLVSNFKSNYSDLILVLATGLGLSFLIFQQSIYINHVIFFCQGQTLQSTVLQCSYNIFAQNFTLNACSSACELLLH